MNEMTNEQQTLKAVRGIVGSLPPAERQTCVELANLISEVARVHGEVGILALALVGAALKAGETLKEDSEQ